MIPANIDLLGIIADLNRWGIGDRKIEAICNFSVGYATHTKNGKIKEMSYQKAARLYNFWLEECELRGVTPPWTANAENPQHLVAST